MIDYISLVQVLVARKHPAMGLLEMVTLRDICLQSAAKNIEKIGHRFNQLPPLLIDDLYKTAKNLRIIRKLHHLDYLIHPNMQKLDLTCDVCTQVHSSSLEMFLFGRFIPKIEHNHLPILYTLGLVEKICKNLIHLDLSYRVKTLPDELLPLVNHIPNIKILNLRYVEGCDERLLNALGEECHQLKELDIGRCAVSDYGIRCLVMNSDGTSRNLKITKLKIDGTNVTALGTIMALQNLKDLKILEGSKMFKDLENNVQKDIYNLEELIINDVSVFKKDLEFSTFSLPKITKIAFSFVKITNEDLKILSEFVNLKKLILFNVDSNLSFPLGIEPLLTKIGRNLVVLGLGRISMVDVGVIGHFCTNLLELSLDKNKSYVEISLMARSENCFEKVIELRISEDKPIPVQDFTWILVNCKMVKKLNISYCRALTEGVLRNVIMSNPMKHLMEIEVRSCTHFSPRGLICLLELQNSLKFFSMYTAFDVFKEDGLALLQFVRENKPDLKYLYRDYQYDLMLVKYRRREFQTMHEDWKNSDWSI